MTENTPITINQLAIKAVCVIGFINATQMLNLIFSPITKQLSAFFPVYFAVSVIISLLCLAGLWFFKRWAAIVYAIVLICNQIVLMVMGFWEITALIIPVAIIGLLYHNRGRMN